MTQSDKFYNMQLMLTSLFLLVLIAGAIFGLTLEKLLIGLLVVIILKIDILRAEVIYVRTRNSFGNGRRPPA